MKELERDFLTMEIKLLTSCLKTLVADGKITLNDIALAIDSMPNDGLASQAVIGALKALRD